MPPPQVGTQAHMWWPGVLAYVVDSVKVNVEVVKLVVYKGLVGIGAEGAQGRLEGLCDGAVVEICGVDHVLVVTRARRCVGGFSTVCTCLTSPGLYRVS